MNIEQERKEFEKWAFQASRGWASFERDSYDKYWPDKLNLAWGAWQAAKSQVVPEGFVLVPKEKIASLVDELHVAFKSNLHLTTGELLPLQQDFQLMIEAQEQSHE
ncbi:hypothetical protein ACUM6W_02535 [Acinetobacter tandoii]|uniref:hypothetical protein n=1 Tax=Acinetobacter tandoii TaxID=202954 RepID=UPI0040462D9D